jgi:GNAT superfamily N-acetyltransferase
LSLRITVLGRGDDEVLTRVAAGVFDHPISADLREQFLGDPRHHMAVALDSDVVVGMASGVHYVHPDKPPELWINEVGVAPLHRGQGIATRLLEALLDVGRQCGCREAWVLTERDNSPAMRLYAGRGGREAARDQVMFTFDLGGPLPAG